MQPLISREFGGRTAHLAHSTRVDGDLSPSTVSGDVLTERRQQAIAHPWCVVRQVHSDRVVLVSGADAHKPRPVADALVTSTPNLVVAVHSGDCVPVGFITSSASIAVAHAGWKGLEAGVLESTVRRLRELDAASEISAVVGPHIRAPRYEFGVAELGRLTKRFGPDAQSQTLQGTPALDLTAAIAAELARVEVPVALWSPHCTAAKADLYWSHRARQESGRIALVGWIEHTGEGDGLQ